MDQEASTGNLQKSKPQDRTYEVCLQGSPAKLIATFSVAIILQDIHQHQTADPTSGEALWAEKYLPFTKLSCST